MSDAKFTTDEMRRHVRSPNRTIAWDGTCTTMIRWAADVIDAANELAKESEYIRTENSTLKEQNALLTVQVQRISYAADAVIKRWDSPDWKDAKHTADYIHKLRDTLTAHPQQVKSEDARECRWTPMDEENMPGTYEGSCGVAWSFIEGGIKENDTLYCPRCGGKIVDVEAISAQDEKEWGL